MLNYEIRLERNTLRQEKYILIELLLILLMFMVLFLSGLASGLGRAVSSAIDTMNADSFIVDDSAEQLITVSSVGTQVLDELRSAGANAAPLDIQRMYIIKDGDDEKRGISGKCGSKNHRIQRLCRESILT